MSLTPRQKDALDFIVEFQTKHQYSPTYREVAAGIGVSSHSRAANLVHALQDRGYVNIRPGGKRMIEVLKKNVIQESVLVP